MVRAGIAGICFLFAAAVHPLRAEDNSQDNSGDNVDSQVFETQILPLIQTHCFDCHGSGETSGSVDLEGYSTLENVIDDVQVWETIAKVISDGVMPPEDAAPMAEEDKRRVIDFSRRIIEQVNQSGQRDLAPTAPRRLTRREYVNTIRDLLGVSIDAETFLPEDKVGASGFRNDATELMVPAELLEKYLMLADTVVTEATNGEQQVGRNRLITVRPSENRSAEAAATQIIQDFGRRAFRRPLTSQEIEQYVTLYKKMEAADAGFDISVGIVAKAMLISPHFLFRIETVQPADGIAPINDYELATRLSYLIWSSSPDDRLLDLADAGQLSQAETLVAEVRRMLADDRAASFAEEFVEQWLFSHVTPREPDSVVFPSYTPELDAAAREELKRFVIYLLQEDRSLLELIDSDYIFVNGALANHYGIDGEVDQWQRVSLSPQHHRGGLLGMARVLQRTSMSDRTSPTVRGAWVLDAMLGTPPPPPPPDVNNTIDQSNSGTERALTFREKLAMHANDGTACASCHKKMDPIGFAMDNYDGIGRWRTESFGLPIDPSGTTSDGRVLNGIDDLKQLLLDHKEQFIRNLSHQFLVYALGRELTGKEYPTVSAIVRQISENEFRASSMVVAVVQSFPFNHKKHPAALAIHQEELSR